MSDKLRISLRYIFVAGLGTLLHFTYQWSGSNPIVGAFSAANESVWEHLKLIYFPMLALTLWDLLTTKVECGFLLRRIISILVGMAFTVICFYTILGVTGEIIDWFNILTYLVAMVIVLFFDKKLNVEANPYSKYTAIAIFTFLLLAFIAFTYRSPGIGIFYAFKPGETFFR